MAHGMAVKGKGNFDDLYRVSNFMNECMQGRAHAFSAKVGEEAK